MKMLLLILAGVLATALVVALAMNKALIKVGSGYSAKVICSNHYLTSRQADEVLSSDVQAPGHPLLKFVRFNINESSRQVTASLLGLGWASATAHYREGYGCALLANGKPAASLPAISPLTPIDSKIPWPRGNASQTINNPALTDQLERAMAEPGTRSLVIIHNGQLVAESYAAGFNAESRHIGWSLTKSVMSIITGMVVDDGLIAPSDTQLFEHWTDDRRLISLENLLHMESGLAFDETYGKVSDVTRMLFLEADMAGFTASLGLRSQPGSEFRYASGTSNVLSSLLRQRVGNDDDWYAYPGTRLFEPLGMSSAVFETDAAGNFVGSSYLYASARDWARVGQLLLQRGQWAGKQLVSAEWVDYIKTPAAKSNSEYGAHLWLRGEGGDEGFDLPDDTFWLLGHDSQSVAIVPSHNLVVVRLGLTPDGLGFKPQRLVQEIIQSGVFN